MTEQQIKQELRKHVDAYATPDLDDSIRTDLYEAYREGYIAGATEAIKELSSKLVKAEKVIDMYKEQLNKNPCVVTPDWHCSDCLKENEELKKQIEKMKSNSKTAYTKGIKTMANALKKYDREEGAWTDYFEHTVDKVLKNLLKEFSE